jgi:hypothetical protein
MKPRLFICGPLPAGPILALRSGVADSEGTLILELIPCGRRHDPSLDHSLVMMLESPRCGRLFRHFR